MRLRESILPGDSVSLEYKQVTLKQLEAFYLAATLGSFAIAAQRIHVTQSSLSKRIAELEDRSAKTCSTAPASVRI